MISLPLKFNNMIIYPRRREEDLYVNDHYKVIYDDESFLVVDKPSPLPVHPVGRFKEKNLLSILKRDPYRNQNLRIVNRLDSETSGLVLVAKTKEDAFRLARQFETRKVEKEYVGIVFGVLPEKKGRISFPLGLKVENNYHLRTIDPEGESAETLYEVVAEGKGYSWLRLKPLTGRMHQVRAHLAFFGNPIVGDKIYIDNNVYDRYVRQGWQDDMLEVVKLPRLALHACWLKITHPRSEREMEFYSDPPEMFSQFFNLGKIVS